MDDAVEWTWASSAAEIEAVEFVLRKFFTLQDGKYVQARIQEEIDTYQRNCDINSRIATEREAKRKELSTDRDRSVNEAPPNQEPVTINQEPRTKNQEPEAQKSTPIAPAVAAPRKKKANSPEEPNPLNMETWKAYKHAYAERYKAPPVQNAKSNALIKQIVQALGSEAPAVAEFFVWHQGRNYVAAMHQVGLLLHDHAKLRTEWATNDRMTATKAAQADKTATNYDAFAPLIAAAKAREEAERNKDAQQ
jgi:uncharacterized protein YdaU (DUF1376 family)